MPDNTLYVIDTSYLIDYNRHLNRPFLKSLRNDLDRLIKHGRLIAPIQVLHEIEEKDDADSYIVVLAIEKRDGPQSKFEIYDEVCVVTEEKIDGNKLKIPFICNHYGINCFNFTGMCLNEGWEY